MILAVDGYNLAADRRGMGRVVRQTLRSLDRLGAEIVAVVRGEGDAAAIRREFGYRTIAARELARERPAAVWYAWNGMRFAPRAPSIVTVYDAFAFTYPHRGMVARWREQAPIRRALRRADFIFAGSAWTARELRRLFAIEDDRLGIFEFAPDPFWQPVAPPHAEPYLLFLAGPDARKNAAMLFRAYDAAFAQGGPELIVAGTLSEADEALLSRMRAPHRRLRPGDAQLRELYSGALAVAVPSLAEGFGLPAVEAMACGAPVLASDASALPETCGGAALLLSPYDEDAWRDALVRIAGDAALRAQLRERGLARVARMDPDAPAKALLACVRRFRAGVR